MAQVLDGEYGACSILDLSMLPMPISIQKNLESETITGNDTYLSCTISWTDFPDCSALSRARFNALALHLPKSTRHFDALAHGEYVAYTCQDELPTHFCVSAPLCLTVESKRTKVTPNGK